MFVRFVTHRIDRDSGRRVGLFQIVSVLMDRHYFDAATDEAIRTVWNWFMSHLSIPTRFNRSDRSQATPVAISWFKSDAREHVAQMREMCRLLDEAGVSTEMIWTDRPGYIVYEDDHQIVAVPFADTPT